MTQLLKGCYIKCVYGAPGGRGAVRNTVSSAGGARRGECVGLVRGAPGGCGSVVQRNGEITLLIGVYLAFVILFFGGMPLGVA